MQKTCVNFILEIGPDIRNQFLIIGLIIPTSHLLQTCTISHICDLNFFFGFHVELYNKFCEMVNNSLIPSEETYGYFLAEANRCMEDRGKGG